MIKFSWNVLVLAILASAMLLIATGCASSTYRPQANVVSRMPETGTKKVKELPLRLVISLTDGSRAIGETTLTSLSLRSAVLGKVVIPLEKIREVKFSANHESASVALQNGDKVHGSLGAFSLTLRTLFGVVTVPFEHVMTIKVRHSSVPKPPDGLALWYRFDSDEGEHVTDRSGHGNHGLVQNTKYVSTGKVGGAMEFSNYQAAIRVSNSPALQLQDFTIAVWMKRNSKTRVSPSYVGANLFSYGRDGYVLGIAADGRNDGHFYLSKNGLDHVDSHSIVTDTEFHHVAVTKIGQQVVFFVDGVPDFPMFYDTRFEFHTDVAVGATSSSFDSNFLGAVSEVMVFSRALSAEEVKTLADSQ